MTHPPLLEVAGVTVAFGGVVAVNHVSFQVRPGEVLGIIGPNGAGKTTLFNTLTGLVTPVAGSIRLGGEDITRWPTHRRSAAGIARTLQTPEVYTQITVRENLMATILGRHAPPLLAVGLGLPGVRRREAAARQIADGLIEASLLRDEADKIAGDLPFGHQRLLEIDRALAGDPRIVLLDEPLAGLSREEVNVVLDVVRSMGSEGRAVLMVEHDLPSVLAVASRVLVLAEGELIADGPPAAVQEDAAVRRVYLGHEERHSAEGGLD